jgi:AraC family transcriptional regulator
MLKPYELLKNILTDIEKGIQEDIDTNTLAVKFMLSERHLRKLFKFAFNQPLGGYIRSRKLAVSLNDLLKTDSNVLEIALNYGFDYEETFIRAFRREFGMTPGELRKSGTIIKVKPPIHLLDENRIGDNVTFGPEIVMVPQFHVIGKRWRLPLEHGRFYGSQMSKQFLNESRDLIKNAINPHIYFGLANNINSQTKHVDFLPSVQVKNLKNIPNGYSGDTFKSALCARFRYIFKHHYYDMNESITVEMFKARDKYANDKQVGYTLLMDTIHFERIDTELYDGNYCPFEWYTPVIEKA